MGKPTRPQSARSRSPRGWRRLQRALIDSAHWWATGLLIVLAIALLISPDNWIVPAMDLAIAAALGYLIYQLHNELVERNRLLRERYAQLDLANDAILVRDLNDIITYWNPACERTYGWTAAEAIGQNVHALLRTELPESLASIEQRFFARGEWRGELIHYTRAGDRLIVASTWSLHRDDRGRPVANLEIGKDMTAAKRAEIALRTSEQLYRTLAEHFPNGAVFLVDRDLRYTIAAGEALPDLVGGVVLTGRPVSEVGPAPLASALTDLCEQALAGKTNITEHCWQEAIYRLYVLPVTDASGSVFAGMAMVQNITESKRAEARSRFLASATTLLSASLDYETTLRNLAHLIVPQLADWCTINLAVPDTVPHLIAVAHADPDQEVRVWQLQGENRTPQTAQVIRTGESLACFELCDLKLAAFATTPRQRQLLDELGLRSYLCVPLRIGDRVLGSILCVWGPSPRHYSAEDLKLAEDLAYRAALAIDNARLYAEAQEAVRLKAQFLATMSHELRTPMNAIIGFSQVLLRQRSGALQDQQVQMLQCIHTNGKSLLALIDDILDLSKIEARRLELKLKPFNLGQLVKTTLAELQPLADDKGLDFRFETELDNLEVCNDRDRLRQILVNLLANAIKFTERGWVAVRIAAAPESRDRLCLSVQDTGIGIAPEQQTHIFEEFRQVDQTSTRRYSGTGLGLAIAKSLVELMQGQIAVSSELGAGATFQVWLPRRVSPPATADSLDLHHPLQQVQQDVKAKVIQQGD